MYGKESKKKSKKSSRTEQTKSTIPEDDEKIEL